MTVQVLMLILLGPFLVVCPIALVAQACGGPVFFSVRMPNLQLAVRVPQRQAVAW